MSRRRRAEQRPLLDVLSRRTPEFLLYGRGMQPMPRRRSRSFGDAFLDAVGHRSRDFARHHHARATRAAVLRRVELRFLDLSERNLTRVEFQKANLAQAHLTGSDMSRARLFRVTLESAQMSDVKLVRADLREANLAGATLRRADLRDADLRGARLDHADLRGARFDRADLRGASLIGCEFDEDLDRARLRTDATTRWEAEA